MHICSFFFPTTLSQCPLFGQAKPTPAGPLPLPDLELMEDGLMFRQCVKDKVVDGRAANQQIIPSDEEGVDEYAELLAGFSKKERKKILKKLSKMDPSEEGGVVPGSKRRKERKNAGKEDEKSKKRSRHRGDGRRTGSKSKRSSSSDDDSDSKGRRKKRKKSKSKVHRRCSTSSSSSDESDSGEERGQRKRSKYGKVRGHESSDNEEGRKTWTKSKHGGKGHGGRTRHGSSDEGEGQLVGHRKGRGDERRHYRRH